MLDDIDKQIKIFNSMKLDLLNDYLNKFVVIKDGEVVLADNTFDSVAKRAINEFGRESYLIRKVEEDQIKLPTSFSPRHRRSLPQIEEGVYIEAGFYQEDGKSCSNSLLHHGPMIDVIVSQPRAEDACLGSIRKKVRALIDTGAYYEGAIDERLAKCLGLAIVDKDDIAGITGIIQQPIYIAGIFIEDLKLNRFSRLVSVELRDCGQVHEMLLGREFLSKAIMVYDGINSEVKIKV